MADAIVALSRDRRRWQEISSAARARALELFPVDRVVERYLSLYLSVLQEAAAPRAVTPHPGVAQSAESS